MKKLSCLLAAMGALCIVVVAIAMLFPASRITHANYECIEKGMTLAEVETILGEKPTYPDRTAGKYLHHCWHSDRGEVVRVVFDENQTVVNLGYRHSGVPPKGIVEKRWNRMFPQFPWRHYRRPLEWYGDDD